MWGKVLEFVWEGGRICVGKMVGVSIFVWGRWSIFVGEGARICVRGRWSGGLNLCAGKVDRRRADDHVQLGKQVCVGQQVCEGTRLSTAISPASAQERIYSQKSAFGTLAGTP